MKFKNAKKFIGAAGTGLALLVTGAQVSAGHNPAQTITEIVSASGGQFDRNKRDFDILLQAVVTAGLADALADENADLTVFAPNDRAFIRLARDLGFEGRDEEGAFNAIVNTLTALGNGDPIPLLTNVLLYHVNADAKTLEEVKHTDVIETLLEGGTIVPFRNRLLDNDPDFKNPRFLKNAANIQASNGIIHTINRVLIPADLPNTDPNAGTIVDIVLQSGGEFDNNNKDYDLLLNAVQAAGLVDVLADPAADFTVFAPKDIAFVRLARALGYRGHDEAGAFEFIVTALTELGNGDPIPVLTNVLLYHVSPGTQIVKDVILADSISTALEDATIHPDGLFLSDNAPALRDPRLNINASDIRASNGIIHTINRVLIPVNIGRARH